MARTVIIDGKIYEAKDTKRTVIVNGKIYEEAADSSALNNARISAMHFIKIWQPTALGE